MQMDEGLDTGPMLLGRTLDIRGKTARQVTDELANLGARLLLEWLDTSDCAGTAADAGVTYASKIDKAEARIDWPQTADEIERQARAFNPVPGAWFEVNGERIKLLEAEVRRRLGQAGRSSRRWLSTIATGSGAMSGRCRSNVPAEAPMTPEELLRGFAIPAGTILP